MSEIEILPADAPLERAARLLREKMEHLDPTERGGAEWHAFSDWEKDYYRVCVEDILTRVELVHACLIQLANDHGIDRSVDVTEQLHLDHAH